MKRRSGSYEDYFYSDSSALAARSHFGVPRLRQAISLVQKIAERSH